MEQEKSSSTSRIRVKSNFSIEDILSRPDKNEYENQLMKRKSLQNSYSLFYGTTKPYQSEAKLFAQLDKSVEKNEINNITEDQDHETNSEVTSDDGNSSVHSEFSVFEAGLKLKIVPIHLKWN